MSQLNLYEPNISAEKILELIHQTCPHWECWHDVNSFEDIHLERISGAMTNCVFVISGPEVLPIRPLTPVLDSAFSSLNCQSCKWSKFQSKKQPRKLLLRVYGTGMETVRSI